MQLKTNFMKKLYNVNLYGHSVKRAFIKGILYLKSERGSNEVSRKILP